MTPRRAAATDGEELPVMWL